MTISTIDKIGLIESGLCAAVAIVYYALNKPRIAIFWMIVAVVFGVMFW